MADLATFEFTNHQIKLIITSLEFMIEHKLQPIDTALLDILANFRSVLAIRHPEQTDSLTSFDEFERS